MQPTGQAASARPGPAGRRDAGSRAREGGRAVAVRAQKRAKAARSSPLVNGRFDARANGEYWAKRPLAVAVRGAEIGARLGWWIFCAQLQGMQDRKRTRGVPGGAELREALTALGPSFVKIGQALAARPDILPATYVKELEKLQDRIPAFSDDAAMKVIHDELGAPAAEYFSGLSTSPVAAASLGQVYKATLRGTGEEVAVKVQRPGVLRAICLDAYILRAGASWFRSFRKLNSDLPAILDEWCANLVVELDYRVEAANGRRFRDLYGHQEGVYVPHMYPELTSRRVLVMEWVNGTKLRSAPGERGRAEDLALVEVGVQLSLEQVVDRGFYHADPHAGNLLRTESGELAYLDFGMMGTIERPLRQGLIRATLHMVNGDFEQLGRDMEELGLLPPGSDQKALVPVLTRLLEEATSDGVVSVSFTELTARLGATMYDFQFRIPPFYTLLIRSLAVLEGIAITSDPDYKVIAAAYPWVARRLLTDTSPELRATLDKLLYRNGSFQFDRLESLLEQAVLRPGRAGFTDHDTRVAAPRTSASGDALLLLLSDEGRYVRDILVEELAKGVDAAWRVVIDSAVDSSIRDPLTRAGDAALALGADGTGVPLLPGRRLAVALREAVPSLAEEDDVAQLRGIQRLATALAEISVAGGGGAGNGSASGGRLRRSLRGPIVQAAGILEWVSVEAAALTPAARQAALRLPMDVLRRAASRAAARTVRSMLADPIGDAGGAGAAGGRDEAARRRRAAEREADAARRRASRASTAAAGGKPAPARVEVTDERAAIAMREL
ncbi:unnamed protein product [Pedinophyceae sp. YPF-701]|nr:unnamed protein product [Pedinophyceae sp. YPF-701]